MIAAGQIALSILSWIWNHKLLALVIGLSLALAWSRHELSVVTIERDAAQTKIMAYQHDAETATTRANDNYVAVKSCFAQVEQDKASIALQNDANEKLRASFNDMERAAVNLETEKAQLLQTLEDRTAATEAEAKAHPDQVVPVGLIVRARVEGLWK